METNVRFLLEELVDEKLHLLRIERDYQPNKLAELYKAKKQLWDLETDNLLQTLLEHLMDVSEVENVGKLTVEIKLQDVNYELPLTAPIIDALKDAINDILY